MSDLPSPYTLPDYAKPTNKIRIRPVHTTQTATPRLVATKQESTPLTLKVPPVQPSLAQVAAPSKASTPALAANTSTLPVAPVTAQRPPARAPAPKPSTSQAQPAKKSATPQPAATGQPVAFIHATPSHYPRTQTPQVPSVPLPTVVTPTVAPAPVLRASSVLNTTQTRPQTPVVYPLSRQLKSINVQIQPNHRRLMLDHRDGVKTWFVRLVPGESSLLVSDVTYMEEEEEESSEDEHIDAEEEDDSMDVDHEVSPSKRKGKARGRGRPPKAVLAAKAQAAAAKAAKTAKKKARKPEDIQLKLNNFIVSEQPEKPGEWNVCLVTGSNVIEIGEAGGMVWKLHAERIADA
jgi:chromatin structure-remodeling complex subunit RSC4